MKALHLTLVSPERELFSGEVERVTLPGTLGSFTVLQQHAPIVSSLQAGKLTYVTPDGEEHTSEVQGGFMEMSYNTLSVCVD